MSGGDIYYTQTDIMGINGISNITGNYAHDVPGSNAVMADDGEDEYELNGFLGKLDKLYIKYKEKRKKKKEKDNMAQSPIPMPIEERVIVKANKNGYQAKYIAKHKAKNRIKTKFKIGRYYFQRIKPKDGSPNVVIKYQCVKTIYSIKDIETNIVIMRQITPYDGRKFTLDRQECQKFHIKYEPGLEVWPMEINWIPEKNVNI